MFSGRPPNAKRYRMNMVTGYALPLIISFCTLITEFSADECALYRPRFNEETCFFASLKAKTLWFFAPIGNFLSRILDHFDRLDHSGHFEYLDQRDQSNQSDQLIL